MTKDDWFVFSWIAVVVVLLVFGLWATKSLGTECRTDHSWLYCVHFLNK
jgi:hypothetical protein